MATKQQIEAWDKAHFWHPFTQMKEYVEEPALIIAEGRGFFLFDADGREYIDGVSSLWCNVHGHRKQEIDDAIRGQLDRIAHSTTLGPTHEPAARLAKRLVEIAPPGLNKVFYSDAGATAVEIALKMAFQYWQLKGRPDKTTFVALEESYHGDTIGAVSVGGIELFHRVFKPLLFDTVLVPSPFRREPKDWLATLEDVIAARHERIAALILEPLVQGAGGMLVYDTACLAGAADICRRHKVLLIADEVATGFGRTGKMFACEHAGATPDLMCVAKGLTGGYLPLAATLATDEIYRAFLGDYAEFRTFFHGHTFTGNPLACAAALASIDLFESEGILEHMGPKIDLVAARLGQMAGLPHVGHVRVKGLMGGIELVKDKAALTPYAPEEKMGMRVCLAARRRGLLMRPLGNVIVVMPAPAMPIDLLARQVNIVYAAIREVTES